MMKMKVEKTLTSEEVKKVVASEISKSEKMKQLFQGGLDVKEIANIMGTRYNFVYNVVSNMIRVNDLEDSVVKETKDNKHSQIVELLKAGKSNIEISKELKVNYNYVWKVVNEELRKEKGE